MLTKCAQLNVNVARSCYCYRCCCVAAALIMLCCLAVTVVVVVVVALLIITFGLIEWQQLKSETETVSQLFAKHEKKTQIKKTARKSNNKRKIAMCCRH